MKPQIALPAVIIAFTLFSCGALKHVNFYQNFNESATIPALNLSSMTDTFTTPDIPTNVEAQLKQNNTSPNLVQSVKLQTLTLSISSPPGANFSSLKDIQIFILTDSLPPVEIANKYNISSNSDTLNLNVDNTELKPYLISNSFKMRYITTNRTATTSAMTLNVYMRFMFQANLLAAL